MTNAAAGVSEGKNPASTPPQDTEIEMIDEDQELWAGVDSVGS